MKRAIRVQEGRPFPHGATPDGDGVNFALFSLHAASVELLIYEHDDSDHPTHVIALDINRHRSRQVWHVRVDGLEAGVWYTWRVDGDADRSTGDFFDPGRELLDPHARVVSTVRWSRSPDAAANAAIRAQVVAEQAYDWGGDAPLERFLEDEIIYELHVGGFTRHASSGVSAPGTFKGLAEKIPWLRELGVTAVELLPVMAFDVEEVPPGARALGLRNFWGYSTCAWYALHTEYAASDDIRTEFRDLVRALHAADIAVILDVVFNHTAEGGVDQPTISFRGIDNRTWYHQDPEAPGAYRDFSGCGNTINCNHPIVAATIVDCLEYWVREFHVDGFRLDLASVLSRGEDGEPDAHARVLWQIEQSAILRERILIAEPWDAVGLHQLGGFPGFAWSEWNDRYRDTLRGFLRGDSALIGEVATRIAGSSDLFMHAGKRPRHGINFLTCHDGFTLADLVSYEQKHNEANGEDNADGHNHNVSWNSGIEGETDDTGIRELRLRRMRNFFAVLLLSQGVPMLCAGDELARTQRGNNNAYCQDNELSWLDWTGTSERDALTRFVSGMIELRKRHAAVRRRSFIVEDDATLHWFAYSLESPDWHDPHLRVLCFRLAPAAANEPAMCVLMNMDACSHDLPLPAGRWRRCVDTALSSPQDIVSPQLAPAVEGDRYTVRSHAVVVLESDPGN